MGQPGERRRALVARGDVEQLDVVVVADEGEHAAVWAERGSIRAVGETSPATDERAGLHLPHTGSPVGRAPMVGAREQRHIGAEGHRPDALVSYGWRGGSIHEPPLARLGHDVPQRDSTLAVAAREGA